MTDEDKTPPPTTWPPLSQVGMQPIPMPQPSEFRADDDERAEALLRAVKESGDAGGWPNVTHPQWPEPPQRPKPRKRRKRVFMWTFIGIQILFLAVVIIQLSGHTGPTHADIVSGCYNGHWQGLFKSQQDCVVHYGRALNGAGEAGKGIGAALIFGLWVGLDVILGIGRLVVVTSRHRGSRGNG